MTRRHITHVDIGGGPIEINVTRHIEENAGLRDLHELLIKDYERKGRHDPELASLEEIGGLIRNAHSIAGNHFEGVKGRTLDQLVAVQRESLAFYEDVFQRKGPDVERLRGLVERSRLLFDELHKPPEETIREAPKPDPKAVAVVERAEAVKPTPATSATTSGLTADTVVSVNTASGIFHPPGTRWHGSTGPNWRRMTVAEAEAAGYRSVGVGARIAPPTSVYSVERPQAGDPRVVIRSWINPGETRAGLERQMASAGEYGFQEIADWHRAHSQSPGLGGESGEAIRLASRLVNLELQNQGIEGFLRTLRDLEPDARLHLTTETQTHPKTLRLKSIHYIVERLEGDRRVPVFEAAVEMRLNGEARAGIRPPGSDEYLFGNWWTP